METPPDSAASELSAGLGVGFDAEDWIDKATANELRGALRKEMEDCHDMARRFVAALDQRNDARSMLRRVIDHDDAREHALFAEALDVLARTGNKTPNV
jgi:hypothetical protein